MKGCAIGPLSQLRIVQTPRPSTPWLLIVLADFSVLPNSAHKYTGAPGEERLHACGLPMRCYKHTVARAGTHMRATTSAVLPLVPVYAFSVCKY